MEGRALLAPLAVSVSLVALDALGESELRPRVFAGTAIVYVVLGVVADKSPDLAESFAWLVVIGQALSRGPRVFSRLGGIVQKEGPPSDGPKLRAVPPGGRGAAA